jgi:4-aminobutyrate---pyruvate transaminase
LHGFSGHPLVGESRGVGLMGALELVADKPTKRSFEPSRNVGLHCFSRAEDRGLIIRAIGDTIAFCPPLIITEPQIDEMFDRFAKALDETQVWISKEA